MSRVLSCIAAAVFALLPLSVAGGQVRAVAGDKKMTVTLRRPAWFGFALDCSGCARTGTSRPAATSLPVITRVLPESPAALASLVAGDTIAAVDGKTMTLMELRQMLEGLRGGAVLRLTIGSRSGRKPVTLRATDGNIEVLGPDSLPVRYRGEYAEVTVDVLSMSAPVVTRDSTGAMIIKIGEHILRLHRAP